MKSEVLFHWLIHFVSFPLGTALETPHGHPVFPSSIGWLLLTHHLEEVARGCPTSSVQGYKDSPVIWPIHQSALRRPQHTTIPSSAISPPFPAPFLWADHRTTGETWHSLRVPRSFSHQPNKRRVDSFPGPKDPGHQREVAVKWLRCGMFYILNCLIVHLCYSLVKFLARKSWWTIDRRRKNLQVRL